MVNTRSETSYTYFVESAEPSMIDSLELLVEIAIKQGDKLEAQNLCRSALEAADEIGNQKQLAHFKSKLDSLNSQGEIISRPAFYPQSTSGDLK